MTKQLQFLIIITLSYNLFSCGPNSAKDIDTDRPGSSSYITKKLESAFKQESPEAFGKIFKEWNEAIQPNTEGFIEQNDTIRAVFEVYRDFYTTPGSKREQNLEYTVVQNKITYVVTGPEADSGSVGFGSPAGIEHFIDDFRPPLNLDV